MSIVKYLFLTRFPPFRPLRGGEFDYAAKLIEYLAKDSDVHAVAFANTSARIQNIENVRWTLVPHQDPPRWRSILSTYPNVAFRNVSHDYFLTALEAARHADAVFVDFIAMAWCVKKLASAMRGWARRPKLIFICHNHEWAVRWQMVKRDKTFLRIALALDAYKARRLELAAICAADGITSITTSDAAAFKRVIQTPSVTITPGFDGPSRPTRTIGPEVPPNVAIIANYASQHKRMVVAHALAGLCATKQEIAYSLDIVGDGDIISFSREYPHVRFLGYVENIQDYLNGVRIGLVPDVVGGGFKMRVLMYAANRVPILAVESAMQGMGFRAGVDYHAVQSLAEMRAALPGLLNDYATLNSLQNSAYTLTTSSYQWPTRIANLKTFVSRLMAPRGED